MSNSENSLKPNYRITNGQLLVHGEIPRESSGSRKRSFSQMIKIDTGHFSKDDVIPEKCRSCEEYSVLLDYYRKRVQELEGQLSEMNSLIKCEPDSDSVPSPDSHGHQGMTLPTKENGLSNSKNSSPTKIVAHEHEVGSSNQHSPVKESLKLKFHVEAAQPVDDDSPLNLAQKPNSSTSDKAISQFETTPRSFTRLTPLSEMADLVMAHDNEAPRSGILPRDVAKKFQMIEVIEGTDVFWTANQMISCMENSRDNPCKLLSLMVDIFFTRDDLKSSSAHGQGRYRALDKQIIKAILAFIERQYYKLPPAKITQVINNKCAHVRRGPRTGLYNKYKIQRQMRRMALQQHYMHNMHDDGSDEMGDVEADHDWEIEISDSIDQDDFDGYESDENNMPSEGNSPESEGRKIPSQSKKSPDEQSANKG